MSKRRDLVENVLSAGVVIVGVCVFVWVLGAGPTGLDTENWEPLDIDNTCYVHHVEVNNVWLTPGKEYETRNVYCKQ